MASAGPNSASDTLRNRPGSLDCTVQLTTLLRLRFGRPNQPISSSKYWNSWIHPSFPPRNMRPVLLSLAMAPTTTSSVATAYCVRTIGSKRSVPGANRSACKETSTGVEITRNQLTPATKSFGRAVATLTICCVTPTYSTTSGTRGSMYFHITSRESKDRHMWRMSGRAPWRMKVASWPCSGAGSVAAACSTRSWAELRS
mmetsp:Transcript_105111/g.297051  ORF Transcript_105111/g.297051 Transcript_105111/m.297051 type:complete len:200 (-) Transcript_105111:139-738(-)